MIKRTYFMRFRKLAGDGTGSYADQSFTLDYRSVFQDIDHVISSGLEYAEKSLECEKGGDITMMVFNRL